MLCAQCKSPLGLGNHLNVRMLQKNIDGESSVPIVTKDPRNPNVASFKICHRELGENF